MSKRLTKAERLHERHVEGHKPTDAFDFYCVAHESDYSPKYLQGDICHDGMGDGYCVDGCNLCSVPCGEVPCPWPYEDE